MPIEMKDTATIAAKWASRAGAAGSEYTAGVTGRGPKWQAATSAAGDTYEAGVTQAIGRKAFQKGVSTAGPTKWEDKATKIGASRYGQGVSAAQPTYSTGFEKYAGVLKGISLPPRAPKGSPQNLERVRTVADALHKAKTG
jgi:hypothetical protein